MTRKRGGTIKPRKTIKPKGGKTIKPIGTKRAAPKPPAKTKHKAAVTFTVKPAPKPKAAKVPSASFVTFIAAQSSGYYLAEFKKTGNVKGFYTAITGQVRRIASGKWKATSMGSGLALIAFADLSDFTAVANAAGVTPKMGRQPNGVLGVFGKLIL